MLFPANSTPLIPQPTSHSLFDDVVMVGPKKQTPLPSIFYFALTGKESCTLTPINQPAAFLSTHRVRVFSWSLFAHEEGKDNKLSMEGWVQAIQSNHNFVEEFIEKSVQRLTFLIENNWVDPNHIAVCGLSRGGFLSTHWAAHDSRISTLVAFAPLVNLHSRDTFPQLFDHPFAKKLDLISLASKLTNIKIAYYIGNRDKRVGTDNCVNLVNAICEAAYKKRIRSPQISLMISPSTGHLGHGTPSHVFYSGTQYILDQMNLLQ